MRTPTLSAEWFLKVAGRKSLGTPKAELTCCREVHQGCINLARTIASAGGSLIYTVMIYSRHGAVRRRRRPSLLMYTTGRPLIGGSKKAKRILIHRCPSSDRRTAAIVWHTFDDIHRPWRKEPPIKWFDGTHNAAGLSLTVFFLSRPMKNENRRWQTNSPPQPEILLLAFI
jgi:hypothetical protein